MWRSAVFGITGYRNFGKKGFEKRKAEWSKRDEASCGISSEMARGRAVMITGANSGIGKAAALEFAKLGARVHLVCRNRERGEAAREELVSTSGNQEILLHVADLSLMTDIKELAARFMESKEDLHVLVNNAGLLVDKYERTPEGLEVSIATNLYGGFLLTELLLPLLSQSAEKSGEPSRVVSVASGGMYTEKLDVSDPTLEHMKPFDGVVAYAQAKRGQVYLTSLWATRKASQHPNVRFYSMHPGWADTPGVEKSLPSFYQRMKTMLRSPQEGADTIVWLGTTSAPEVLSPEGNGAFFFDREIVRQHLPMCWTESSEKELEVFWSNLRKYSTLEA